MAKVRSLGARWSNNRWLLIFLLSLGKKETEGNLHLLSTYNGLVANVCNRKNIILNFREEKSEAQKA